MHSPKLNKQQYKVMFDEFPVPIFVWKYENDAFILSDYNVAAAEITDGKVAQIIGIHADILYASEDNQHLYQTLRECRENRATIQKEFLYRLRTTDQQKWIKGTWVYTAPDLVMLHTEDITERKSSELALQDSERKYRLLAENIVDIIWTMNPELNRYTYMSPSVTRLGYTPEDFLSKPVHEFIAPKYHKDIHLAIKERLKKEHEGKGDNNISRWELEFLGKNGGTIFVESITRPIRNKEGVFQGLVGVTRDITERKLAEEQLQTEQTFIDAIFNSVPGMLYLYDAEGRLIRWNKKHEEMTGYSAEELSKMHLMDWYKDDLESQEAVNNGISLTLANGFGEAEALLQKKNGSTIPMFFTASLLELGGEKYFTGIGIDISERKQAEKESEQLQQKLIQAQKMEALGTLAAGIAHDFNNLLMGMQGHLSLMTLPSQPSESTLKHIETIEEYIESASNLTQQLLGTAQGGKYTPEPTDLNVLIESSSRMFGRTKKEITVIRQLSQQPVVSEVDRKQLEQVLLNMYVNAWHAMPGGGNLQIRSSVELLDEAHCTPYHAIPGKYAKISVTDSGIGMDELTRQRIFDPFFTTKEKSRGTGLGLASAYGIIKNHGGFLTVISDVGRGSTFTIYLPLSEKAPQQENPETNELLQGTEKILLVDDEQVVTEVAQAMLSHLGYKVTIAGSGHEAVELIKKKDQLFDLILLDMIMPDLDGATTFEIIRKLQPSLPVILSSGYSIDGQAEDIMSKGCNGFIQKPFDLTAISQIVRKVLDN